MIKYHYHDNLTHASLENMRVYCLTIKYNALYKKNIDLATTHVHYYESNNGGILVDLMQVMIHENLYIDSIEITKV
jgi:hypothetical protein